MEIDVAMEEPGRRRDGWGVLARARPAQPRIRLVLGMLAGDTSHSLWKRDQSSPPPDEDVSDDFRGRVYPAEEDTDSVDVQVETDEDFTGRVRIGERLMVAER